MMGCKFTCRGCLRFCFMRTLELLVALSLVLFMPNLPPHCKFDKAYKATKTLPLEGQLALNEKLNNVELWHLGDFRGPEAFATFNGELYTSLLSGDIVKLTGKDHITPIVKFGKPCNHSFEEKICGRPLGMQFDKKGNLYAADAYYGIFKVNVATGDKVNLVRPDVEIEGRKPKLFNSVAVGNGVIYWTDSSSNFDLENGLFDMFADGSGRLFVYDETTKRSKVLMDNLYFANGVILSDDESYLLISETVLSRVHRYHLKGPKAGTHDILLEGLPGFTDNLQKDGHGGYFAPLVQSHDANHPSPIHMFAPFPKIRKLVSRMMGLLELAFSTGDYLLPNDYFKMGVHFVGHFSSIHLLENLLGSRTRTTIIHFNGKGEILNTLHATNGRISGISEAFIYKDHLLIGSPFRDYVGRIALKDIGWEHLKATGQQKTVPETKTAQGQPKAAPTTTAKPKTTTTTAKQTTKAQPKQTAPPPTQAPKVQATTQPLKAQSPKTQPPTPAPKAQPKPATPPPTQAPKKAAPTTKPPPAKVEPKAVPTTQPPTKKATEPPKAAPKPQTAKTQNQQGNSAQANQIPDAAKTKDASKPTTSTSQTKQ